jgi:uncharacterized repeat protein (TIGR01451 family)
MPIFLKKTQPSRLGHRLAMSLFLSGLAIAGFDGIFLTRSALAAPSRKDWCGTVWSVENTSTLAWINPTTGVTTTGSGPTSQITMPGGSMGTSVAAIGIHKESGTMFAFDRNGTTGQLYKYTFGVDAGWIPVAVSGLVGLSGTQSIPGASNNLNKMTVDGNILYITDSVGIALYSINLNGAGTVVSAGALVETYSYVGDPAGTPVHSSSGIGGGDITTDEYGDTYNITYNATTAFFYKQDPGTRTWIYQGQTPATASFAGSAFYKGDLYVKAGNQLKKVDLTRSGSGYTGWNTPLLNIGSPSATNSADLTSCGDPSVIVTKTQKIYMDAAATTLAPDQTKIKTGQYIKYIITMQNKGDSWARGTNLGDNLPIGTSYIPNSATLNGTNLGLATYPTTGFPVSSPGLPTGIIPFAPDPDTATLTFITQVTATSGSVKNRATATYIDGTGLPSEPPNCTIGLNCGETPTVPVVPSPNLLLVKRITLINRQTNTRNGDPLNQYYDDAANPYDDNTITIAPPLTPMDPKADTNKWPDPNTFLIGGINGGQISPNDTLEYTIYFLSAGETDAKNVLFCDRVPEDVSYIFNSFGGSSPLGLTGTEQGMQLLWDGATSNLTNVPDADVGQYFAPGIDPKATYPNINCRGDNTNGAIVVNLGNLPNATTPGIPTKSYGFIRFRGRVK